MFIKVQLYEKSLFFDILLGFDVISFFGNEKKFFLKSPFLKETDQVRAIFKKDLAKTMGNFSFVLKKLTIIYLLQF